MSLVRRIDWSQLWYPGRKSAFTADEMAAAGADAPGPTLVVVVLLNLGSLLALAGLLVPAGQAGVATLALALLSALGLVLAWVLWWRPWRRPLMWATLALMGLMVTSALLVRRLMPLREDREALALVLAGGGALVVVLLWFVVVWRAQQIDGRLREQAERRRAIEMARRLAAAQLEPHFLFNTLASVQHWVQTKDDRAAALLQALTGYLRATLPLFNRPQLALADEALAVRHYLGVMALRMGPRLRWRLQLPEPLLRQALPPGVLLTLVENAVVHGLEPQLAGGELMVSARASGPEVEIEVRDDGAGPPPGLCDGVGLANVRERLTLAWGERARLDIAARPEGGCRALLYVPAEALAVSPEGEATR